MIRNQHHDDYIMRQVQALAAAVSRILALKTGTEGLAAPEAGLAAPTAEFATPTERTEGWSMMIPATEALARLRDGNQRFTTQLQASSDFMPQTRRVELAKKQEPFAIILGCSDARVPAELIFDQGLGDLFVIRVAGNIVAPSQVGSVEFAAARFGTRLVVVLGHSQCGAVLATLEQITMPVENQSRNLQAIVDRIRPSIEGLMGADATHHLDALVTHAVRANIRVSVDHLRHGSAVLEQLIQEEGLIVVGAEYSLETGIVEFFDDAPA